MIIDYNASKITLKKNKNFKSSFQYNMSGIVIEQDGVRVIKERQDNVSEGKNSYGIKTEGSKTISIVESYKYLLKPAYKIVELRKDSPAELAGLLIGDIILKINNRQAHNLKMSDINNMLRDKEDEVVKLKIDRNGTELNFTFRLKSLF